MGSSCFFIFWIFLQITELYLAPRISGAKIKVHPAIMLLGFIGGPLVFGIEGLVLGPLILGVFSTIMKHEAEEK